MNRLAMKRRLAHLYGALRHVEKRRRITLLYHAVGDGPWATPTKVFESHIRLVAERALLVSLDALPEEIENKAPSQIVAALTFDDGYACLLDVALQVLREVNATATVFVNTEHLGETTREASSATLGHYPGEAFLTWRETAALADASWEIGSHGLRHDDLTRASPAEARRQTAESKAVIEVRLGRPCKRFAYTWGRHAKHVREAVRLAGYQEAMTGMRAPRRPNDDPLLLPRINVDREYTSEDLRSIIEGDWDYLGWLARARAALG